jgi:hypothetical protein
VGRNPTAPLRHNLPASVRTLSSSSVDVFGLYKINIHSIPSVSIEVGPVSLSNLNHQHTSLFRTVPTKRLQSLGILSPSGLPLGSVATLVCLSNWAARFLSFLYFIFLLLCGLISHNVLFNFFFFFTFMDSKNRGQ